MPQEIINILLSALGIIITGLASFVVVKLTSWIDTKVKDKKVAEILSTLNQLVFNSVSEVYQTFVETIKNEGKFTTEAQTKALNMCLDKIKSKLAPEIVEFIKNNFGDVTEYLKCLIESTIYQLKR